MVAKAKQTRWRRHRRKNPVEVMVVMALKLIKSNSPIICVCAQQKVVKMKNILGHVFYDTVPVCMWSTNTKCQLYGGAEQLKGNETERKLQTHTCGERERERMKNASCTYTYAYYTVLPERNDKQTIKWKKYIVEAYKEEGRSQACEKKVDSKAAKGSWCCWCFKLFYKSEFKAY